MPPARAFAALVVAGAVSRLAALYVIAFVPYVRPEGLGTVASAASRRGLDLLVAAVITFLACSLDWRRAAVSLVAVAACTLTIVAIARRRIGGATGDVCGATVELGQLATLLVFAAR